MMHDNDARIIRARALELRPGPFELVAPELADDGDVAEIPCQRPPRDTLRRVQPDDRRSGDAKDRFDILADETTIVGEHRGRIPEAERRLPPRNVVIAGYDDDLAVPLRVLDEHTRALKLTRPRTLREVSRDRDDVIVPLGDDRLDRLVLLGHGWMAEVQIRAMEEGRCR